MSGRTSSRLVGDDMRQLQIMVGVKRQIERSSRHAFISCLRNAGSQTLVHTSAISGGKVIQIGSSSIEGGHTGVLDSAPRVTRNGTRFCAALSSNSMSTAAARMRDYRARQKTGASPF